MNSNESIHTPYRNLCIPFISAIRLQPNDALAYKKRADVKGALGMRQEALQDYRMSLDLAYHKK